MILKQPVSKPQFSSDRTSLIQELPSGSKVSQVNQKIRCSKQGINQIEDCAVITQHRYGTLELAQRVSGFVASDPDFGDARPV
ncbi:MAG: hypothetical protein KDG58_04135, partial [Anaerolineae bacterium]|nr:hypothetical protein [Anaerolineae bacterium]